MSTVLKRGGDKWYAVYKDADGKQKWKVGFADKSETVKLARQLEDEAYAIRLGHVDPQAVARRAERGKPAADHLATFKAHMESNGRHPNHIQYTCKDVERCIEHSKITTAGALTQPLVEAWRSHCMTIGYPKSAKGTKATPDSRKTVNRRIASVQAWLRYLQGIGAIERIVINTGKSGNFKKLDTEGHETKTRRALTAEEAAALVEKCPHDNRRELYHFAILTGFRRSECAAMTPAFFNFQQKTITLPGIHAKSKKTKTVPMHSRLVDPLKNLCAGKAADAKLFNVPNRNDVVSILHADCAAAGVPTNDVDMHSLRHTFCSLLAAQGIRPEILMRLARHADVKTTLKYYVHFKPDDERAALERI